MNRRQGREGQLFQGRVLHGSSPQNGAVPGVNDAQMHDEGGESGDQFLLEQNLLSLIKLKVLHPYNVRPCAKNLLKLIYFVLYFVKLPIVLLRLLCKLFLLVYYLKQGEFNCVEYFLIFEINFIN